MNPGVSDLLERWRAEPRPAVAISLCHALAEAGSPRAPTEETLGRPRTPPPAGYYDIVLDVGREAGTRYGEDAEVLLAIGRMYLATGKLVAEAQTIVVRAARLVPTDPRAFRLLGETLLRRGDAVRAVKAFERAIVGGMRDPGTRAWHKRAEVYEPVQGDQGQPAVAARLAHDLGEILDVGAPAAGGVATTATALEDDADERDDDSPVSATAVAPAPGASGGAPVPAGSQPGGGARAAPISRTDAAMAAARAGGPRPNRVRTATLMGMPSSPQQLSARRVIRPGDPELSSPPRMRVDDLEAFDEDEKTRVAQPKTKAGFAGAPADEGGAAPAAEEDAGPRSVVDLSEEDQATQITSMQTIITALEGMPPAPSYRTRMARDSDATQLRGREMLRSPTTEGVDADPPSQPNIWVPAPPEEGPAAGAAAAPGQHAFGVPYGEGEPVIGTRPGGIVDEPSSDATTRVIDRPPIPPALHRGSPGVDPSARPPAEPKPDAGGVRPAPATPMPTLRIPPGLGALPEPPPPPRTTTPQAPMPAAPMPTAPVASPPAPGTMPLTATLQSAAFTAPAPPSAPPRVPVVEAPPPSSARPGVVPRPGRGAPVTATMPAYVAADPFARTHMAPPRDSVVSLTSEAELVDDDSDVVGVAPTARAGSGDLLEVDPDEIEELASFVEPGEDSDVVTIAQLRTRETRRDVPASTRSAPASTPRHQPEGGEEPSTEPKAALAVAAGPPMQATELFDEFGKPEGDEDDDEVGREDGLRRIARSQRGSIADISSIRPLPPGASVDSPNVEPRPMSVRPPPLVPSSPPRRQRSWFIRTMVLSLFVGGAAAGALYYVQEMNGPVDPARGEALAAVAEEALRSGGPGALASADKALRDARTLSPNSRAVAVTEARTRALRVLDDTPSAHGPLRDAIASARKLGAVEEVVGPELALAVVSGDGAAAEALMKQNDAGRSGDALYQLAAGAALERRGDAAAVERYQAAALGGWAAANVRLSRALLLRGSPDVAKGRELAQSLPPAQATVLTALASVVDGSAKAGAPVATAEVADLPLPLRSIAWALSVLSRSEARGASSGLAAAIDDADSVPVAVFCGRVALAVADVEAATQALARARTLSPDAADAGELERQLALLAGDMGKAAGAPGIARTFALLETLSKPEDAAALHAAAAESFPVLREAPGLVPPLSAAARTKLEQARVSRPLDLPWIDLLLADAALDRGDLTAAKAIVDRWPDPQRHRLFASRRARLLRYLGKPADARVAMGEAREVREVRESRRAWVERVLLDAEDAHARERALSSIGQPQDNDQRWAAGYLRAKQGDLAGASKALAKARLPSSPLPSRTLAALTLGELRDKRARGFVQALVTELPKNPDAQQAANLLGITVK